MNNRIVQLLKSRDFSRLAAMIEERYGLATSSEGYEYIYFLAFHSGTTVGGSDTDPWSDSSWWAWVKRQVLHLQSRSPAELLAKVKSQYVALPSSADDWQRLLERLSRALLADEEWVNSTDLPHDALERQWLGCAPATEPEIAEAERRLGRRLPPSLRQFYLVSNGWPVTDGDSLNVLPVAELAWLAEREPHLYHMAVETENDTRPFPDDPDHKRRDEFRDEQGTRVKRSLVISARPGDTVYLLDPGAEPHAQAWPAGTWDSDNPGMSWSSPSFAELVRSDLSFHLEIAP